MAKRKPLGLDELMIVNPGPSVSGAFFLGEDGSLYHVQGVDSGEGAQPARAFFLGEDGILYQVHRQNSDSTAGLGEVSTQSLGGAEQRQRGRFFLGEDGTLYEVVR